MSVHEADSFLRELVSAPTRTPTLVATIFLILLLLILGAPRRYLDDDKVHPGLEIVGMRPGDTVSQAKQRYAEHSRSILDEATAKACYSRRCSQEMLFVLRKPFQVLTPTGPLIVLPAKHLDEIKSHRDLSFHETIAKSFFIRLPGISIAGGMIGFRFIVEHDDVFNEVVRVNLTSRIGKLTAALATEAALAIKQGFSPSKDWTPIVLYPAAVHLVARLSARVFLGESAARDESWLRISTEYAHYVIPFVRALRSWPPAMRPFVQHLLPERRRLRACEAQARRLIAALAEKSGNSDDALHWQEEVSRKHGKDTDVAAGQLALSLVAVHTTSMALTRVMFDLCEHPEWIEPLRDEVRRALAEEGDDGVWTKSTLMRMRLMDSVLKESQRLNPVHLTLMTRIATADVVLPSLPDLSIPAGSMLAVSTSEALRDPTTFPDPDSFIGDRFLRLREESSSAAATPAGTESRSGNKWQYATTSTQHIGFGHGAHACPGRFFAAAELKVALAHLLLAYDWRFEEGHSGGNIEVAQDIVPNPGAVVCFRDRREGRP
ncbi:cytochrome p450 [Diplodia corticola]|uniref:Cytochrome p450 n=1 Tax=Diplodia corticola TaxID=236234 RepID=A0A1J9RJM5_9PEZI|nr:cytochrome p450 [Diplodia corticola]OJD40673.1 cytochrome p450 [Diplodia corticola]